MSPTSGNSTKTEKRGLDVTSELIYLTKALKAPALRDAAGRLAERARSEEWSHEEYLAACLQREVAARDSHGAEGRIRAARFPSRKSIEDFDFDHQRSIKRETIAHLGTLDFVESDSKKFGSWSSNIMTEYHARYGRNGVMIYWHVERRNVCIYTQLKSCSSSEVVGDDRGPAAALHGHRDRVQLRRRARRERRRARLHRAAQLPSAAEAEEHRQHPPVSRGRCPARLASARWLADAADPLGADRPAVRPDGQVRHRPAPGHRGGRAGPAALHPRRPQARHLRRPRRTGPFRPYYLRVRLPGQPRPAPGDPRRAPGRGELEQREHCPALRQGRCSDRPGQGARRGFNALPAPAPVRARAHQHPAAPTGPGRTGLGGEAPAARTGAA
ncbi:ATP-binding protein [Streptomyces hygroscopicus]|nr:ATP-binding protein [Streptomyces hygroscopicus]